ncbi:MAG: hypothetical protein ACI9P5_002633, partial [Saprospiraceae bacterium]
DVTITYDIDPATATDDGAGNITGTAGTYTITADNGDCVSTVTSFTIEAMLPTPVLTIDVTDETCPEANDGSIYVDASGGVPGYTYQWDSATGNQTTATAINLTAGTYSVTVIDNNGCEAVTSGTVDTSDPTMAEVINCPDDITLYVQDCDAAINFVAPTIANNCVTIDLEGDFDGATDEGYAFGEQSLGFTPGVYNIVYTDTLANPDAIACTFTVTVLDTIPPTILCPQTITVSCIENFPDPYPTFTGFIADGGVLDDNCAVSLSTFAHVSTTGLSSPSCTNQDTFERVYTVTDINGNEGMCTQILIIYDDIAPTLTLPANATVDCDSDMSTTTLGEATAVDNCIGGVTITYSDDNQQVNDTSDDGYYEYTIIRTWKAEDTCGNADSMDQIIMVQDTTSPIANCMDTILYLDGNGMAFVTAQEIDNGTTDNCAPIADIDLAIDKSSFSCADLGANTVTLTGTDVIGNEGTCISTVTILDTISPTAICQSITIQLDANGMATIDTLDIDNGSNDNCAIVLRSLDITTFDCNDVGPNTVTLTVTDQSDNTSTCEAIVTVEDNVLPTAICKDTTIYLNANGMFSIDTTFVNNESTDNCGINAITLDVSDFGCSNVGANTVMMTVLDVNGNMSTCSSTVTVVDTIAPVIECKDITVSLDGTGNISITASDVTMSETDACGIASSVIDETNFDCTSKGDNTVTLTVTDENNNVSTCTATVTIIDDELPMANCNDITVSLDNTANGGAYTFTMADTVAIIGATSDNCDFDVTFSQSSFDCSNTGVVQVTATYKDSSNNTSSCTFNVTVNDVDAPSPMCNNITVVVDPITGLYLLTAQDSTDIVSGTTDNCEWTAVFGQTEFDCADVLASPVTVSVTYTDLAGNQSSCNTMITVQDNTAPVADCNDIIVYLDNTANSGTYTFTIADTLAIIGSTNDNCNYDISFSQSTFSCGDVLGGDFQVTATYTDPSNNVSSCIFEVTVLDTFATTLACTDIDVYLDANGFYTFTDSDSLAVTIGAVDNCGIALVQFSENEFECDNVATGVTIDVIYTDIHGNVSMCMSNITVIDTISPIASCKDTTLYLDENESVSVVDFELNGSSSDACGILSYSASKTIFGCSDIGTDIDPSIEVILTVTDINNNTSTCIANVTILDTLAPIIVCLVNDTLVTVPLECSMTLMDNLPTITDNCDVDVDLVITAINVQSGNNIPVTQMAGMFEANYQVGENVVTFTATDDYGNVSTCEFTRTIVDMDDPFFTGTFPDDIVATATQTTEGCGAIINLPNVTVDDICPGAFLVITIDNDTITNTSVFFPIGETTVVYTAVDISGNTKQDSITVTVNGDCNENTDLAPLLTVLPGAVTGTSALGIIAKIEEFGNVDTDGSLITVRIPKDPKITFTWNPTLTSVGPNPVDNTPWTYDSSNFIFHIFTTTDVILANSSMTFGIIGVFDSQGGTGNVPVTLSIQSGSGGDDSPGNNSDSEQIIFFGN